MKWTQTKIQKVILKNINNSYPEENQMRVMQTMIFTVKYFFLQFLLVFYKTARL